MKQLSRLFGLLVPALFLLPFPGNAMPLASRVSANAVRREWVGSTINGPVPALEACPVVVESEDLSFRIQAFPRVFSGDNSGAEPYDATFQADYSFYNPSEYKIQSRVLFPLGSPPDYAVPGAGETHEIPPETYTVSADGKPIETERRYSFRNPNKAFDAERESRLLRDKYLTDAFYQPDLPVTSYLYMIRKLPEDAPDAVSAAIDLDASNAGRRVILLEQSGMSRLENGSLRLSLWAENQLPVHLLVLGEDLPSEPVWTFYRDGAVEDGSEMEGEMSLEQKERFSYEDLLRSLQKPGVEISDVDWYNTVTSKLRLAEGRDSSVDTATSNAKPEADAIPAYFYSCFQDEGPLRLRADQLMCWYAYDLQWEPGQRLRHRVQAPLYPDIDQSDAFPVYTYHYLLSPARTWAGFGPLTIQIQTPYELSRSSPDGFTRNAGGYELKLDGLPDGELTFSLVSPEATHRQGRRQGQYLRIVLGAVGGAALINALLICLLIRRHRKKAGKNRR